LHFQAIARSGATIDAGTLYQDQPTADAPSAQDMPVRR
jgi:hypothetical protein